MHVHPDETVRDAIAILREFGVSQLPVVQAEPPVVLGEMVGAVRDVALMDAAFRDPTCSTARGRRDGAPLPTVGAGASPSTTWWPCSRAPAPCW